MVGGYAVGYHGYPRATGGMDVWIAVSETNAEKIVAAIRAFGMPEDQVTKELLLESNKVIRMGVPPVRIEVITSASGVDFAECFSRREVIEIDGIPVNFLSFDDRKKNKRASGRHKELEDLEHLP